MAGTDHSVILDRLIEMIKANSTLWTEDTEQKTGKLLAVKFGEPEYEKLDARQMPYCYVATPSNRLEDTRNSFGSSVSGIQQPYQSTYQIGVICQNNKTEDTQRQLYSFLKIIRDVIESNPRLGDPVDITTDTKVIRTRIISSERLASQRGKEVDLGIITIQCQIATQLELSIGTIADMSVFSETGNDGRESRRRSNDSGASKVSKGMKTGQRFWEYEYTSAIYGEIDSLIDASDEISVTLKDSGISEALTITPIFQRITRPIDSIKTVILQVEVV